MKVNLDNIQSHIIPVVDTKSSDFRIAGKTMLPAILGCALLQGVVDYIRTSSAEHVASMVITSLDYSKWGLLALGALYFYSKMDAKHQTLNGRRIEQVQIPKQDIQEMQAEIIRLRQENQQLLTNQ
jgi:hypothetical protein